MHKRLFSAFFFLSLFATAAQASHIVGGEIRYTCQGFNGSTGSYFVEMRVYRDCEHGIPFFDNPAFLAVYAGGSNVLVATKSVYFQSVDTIQLADNDPCRLAPNGLCVDVAYYSTTIDLPYNADGYYFVYQRCCRNEIINNITSPAATGATYFVFMSGAAQISCNSSPEWSDYPPVVICLGQPLEFDHSASDVENDQIVYSFCAPLLGGDSLMPLPNPPFGPPYAPVIYSGSYTAAQPMGGNPIVSIDPATGLISGEPDHLGHFAIGVCGQEFRNGELMSEFRRDIQFIVSSCNQSVLVASLGPGMLCDTVFSALDLEIENGTPPYDYVWSNGETTQDIAPVIPGQPYTVSVTDASGCTAQATIKANDCVWPGDANYDGAANNFDILAIGLFYGDNGPVRPGASNDWGAQPAPYWSDYQLNGINTKHADCDGSGSIDIFDSHVVSQNYGQSHPTAFHPVFDPSAPVLTLDLDLPNFVPNSSVFATVNLGDIASPAQGAYGIAFTIVCDPPEAIGSNLVDVNWYGSVFGDINHTLSIAQTFPDQLGRVEAAICNNRRLGFPTLSGLVGKFGFLLADVPPAVPVVFSIQDVRLVNAAGEVLPVNPVGDVLGTIGTQESSSEKEELIIAPNPTNGTVALRSATAFDGVVSIDLYAANGFQVFAQQSDESGMYTLVLNLPETLPAGTYWLRVQDPKQVWLKRIVLH